MKVWHKDLKDYMYRTPMDLKTIQESAEKLLGFGKQKEQEMNEKQYEIIKPEGAPEWFTPGVLCIVWDKNTNAKEIKIIVWYNCKCDSPFIDTDAYQWEHAEPIETWTPRENEAVACWRDGDSYFSVRRFANVFTTPYVNIAKYDGQLDLRVETLKDAQRYKG